jgi:hypothetical protein
VFSGNITKDGDQRRPGSDRRAKRNFSRFLSSRSTKGLGRGVLLLEALLQMYSRGPLLIMEQEDGLQETADRVARAKFPSDAQNIFAFAPLANFPSVFKPGFGLFWVVRSYVSNGRPLVWWYGG